MNLSYWEDGYVIQRKGTPRGVRNKKEKKEI